MGYLPAYKWDLFVSYSHHDAKYLDDGWINQFKQKLVHEIESGILGKLDVFFDQVEQKAYNTIECILQEVRDSAILVIVLSPNWAKSEWCNRELEEFLKRFADPTRIIVAEIEPPDGEVSFPRALPDNLRMKFFETHGPKEVPLVLEQNSLGFRLNLKSFAKDVRDRMMQLRSLVPAAPADGASPANDAGQAAGVLMALSHPDVSEEHEAVEAYLRSQGLPVASANSIRADSREEFVADFNRMLGGARAYVQLLGPRKCQPGALGVSPTDIQFELARQSEIPMLLWLPDWLDPQRIGDSAYRDMLLQARNGSAVPELAKAVIDKVKVTPASAARQPAGTGGIVVINADPEDFELAADLVRACKELDCTAILDDCEINEMSRANWADADAIAFVQGQVSPRWLTARVGAAHRERAASNSGKALMGQVAVYAPPPPKRLGFVGGGNMTELDLSQQWDPEAFARWVGSVVCGSR
jgi:hypothetical protein